MRCVGAKQAGGVCEVAVLVPTSADRLGLITHGVQGVDTRAASSNHRKNAYHHAVAMQSNMPLQGASLRPNANALLLSDAMTSPAMARERMRFIMRFMAGLRVVAARLQPIYSDGQRAPFRTG